jgi:predicted kinase
VRGKVLGFQLDEPGRAPRDVERAEQEARAYFDLAYAYARQPIEPTLVVCMGLPASGKTTLARALASRLGLVHLSSDVLRKKLAGIRPMDHRRDGFQRGIYSRATSRRTYAMLRKQAARWLRRGRSVALDATYGQPSERAALYKLARRLKARLVFAICRADESVLQARLAARTQDPRSVSDARPELWPALRAAFIEPFDVAEPLIVDTTQPLEDTLEPIRRAVVASNGMVRQSPAA